MILFFYHNGLLFYEIKEVKMKKKKVGIPRALLYYKFADMWETFFRQLGAQVVVSPLTTRKIKDEAVKIAPNEDCYSTKLYFGHVLALKDKVDYLFIPRYGGYRKNYVSCPKLIGLAEVLRSIIPDLPPILMPHYNRGKGRDSKLSFLIKAYLTGMRLTKNPLKITKAIFKAIKSHKKHLQALILTEEGLRKWEKSEIIINDPPKVIENEKQLKIALVGHSYVINDPFASLDIRTILQQHGLDIITSEQIPRKVVEEQMAKLEHDYYFEYTREILASVMYFLESKTVDGIIHIMIFSCGPDSIAGDLAARFSKRNPAIPLLQLVFDELTGEAGLRTRIEAFVDMLRRKRMKEQPMFQTKMHV
jgi:predicted nucleotide-binding protein (sugar kinase/HSP70/actin superfamily)